MMRGKWAAGIPPRHLTWVLPDRLASAERPGGRSLTHRKVRRQEEIIWLRENNFTVVVSIMDSPQNLAAYQEFNMPFSHHPIPTTGDVSEALIGLYEELAERQRAHETVLLHQDDLGDLLIGVVAGYLIWTGRLSGAPEATSVVERLFGHQLGPEGRELAATAETLPPRKR
jgi:hypothetical protein